MTVLFHKEKPYHKMGKEAFENFKKLINFKPWWFYWIAVPVELQKLQQLEFLSLLKVVDNIWLRLIKQFLTFDRLEFNYLF